MTSSVPPSEPMTRGEVDSLTGNVVLEFGSATCSICRGFAPEFTAVLSGFQNVRHIKIEDGSGKPLGRSFRVTLWPTLVFLREGKEIAKLVRPSAEEARQALTTLVDGDAS